MFKSKILTILYIICFLALNVHGYAAESTATQAEEAVTDAANTDAESEEDSEEEKPSSDETKESEDGDGDEEPDCD